MNGLILKDLYNLKNNGKSIIFVIVVFSFVFFSQNNIGFLTGYTILLASMLVINTMSYDNIAKWDKYALTMPVTRKGVVFSKYMVSIISSLIGAAIAVGLCFAQGIYRHNLDVIEILTVTGVVLAMGFLFISFMLPIVYKFGVEKSRIFIFIIFIIPFAVIIVGKSKFAKLKLSPLAIQYMNVILQYLPIILLLIAILVMVVSYSISVKVYSNKDM
ncbi:ABC-2 transporter permease [Clostridium sp. AWRP]|uniref:ABC-2 transporter permease n=1 Tax=Clostridium sp. AWRP TaxID=2212991 RepID=UPI000FD7E4E8|nr:ABC-2 transporter permease [Clostridium sp. AWRP]AZV58275.1 ABC-2 transporter permease [Clostridium sp. AWRP]